MENRVHGNTGRPCSREKREKIRAKLLGRKHGPYSQEHRQAISSAKKGRLTPAMRAASDAARGKPTGRDPWNKGKKLGPLSDELKRKIGLAHLGQKRSAETCKRISESRKGNPLTESHRRNLSTGALRRHARGDHRPFRSKLEIRAGEFLEPVGFTPQFRFKFGSSHPFDFCNRESKTLIEVNGCYWHAHECATCRRVPRDAEEIRRRDEMHRADAVARGYRVVVLWQCQENNWPIILKREEIL